VAASEAAAAQATSAVVPGSGTSASGGSLKLDAFAVEQPSFQVKKTNTKLVTSANSRAQTRVIGGGTSSNAARGQSTVVEKKIVPKVGSCVCGVCVCVLSCFVQCLVCVCVCVLGLNACLCVCVFFLWCMDGV
jgi:hypothetical protein